MRQIAILRPKVMVYPVEMTLGKRIREARAAIKPKLTQGAIAKHFDITIQAVSAWERDEDTPTPDKFPKLAEILGKTVAYLHGHNEGNVSTSEAVTQNSRIPTPQIMPAADLLGEADLPVHAIVRAGRLALVLEKEPYTHVKRPKRLEGRRDGYGILVIGDSMSDEYNEGDIAYVDPRVPPREGDPCVFQGLREGGTVEVTLRYLDSSPDTSETVYYVRTGRGAGSPRRKSTIKKADWQKCHVMVGKESGR